MTLKDRKMQPPHAIYSVYRARQVEVNEDRPILPLSKRQPRDCRFQRRTDCRKFAESLTPQPIF